MSAVFKTTSKHCLRSSIRSFSLVQKGEAIPSCFTWGQTGKESSLGLGEGVDDLAVPTEMDCPDTSGFVQVCHGPKTSAIITGNGRLYTFGASTCGQLGHGEAISNVPLQSLSSQFMKTGTLVEKPKLVETLQNEVVVRVVCGTNHTACVTEKGELWTWGWGGPNWGFGCGGLGHGNKNDTSIPLKVEGLNDVVITDVACGDSHTLALDNEGKIWAFGEGEYGRLGLGGTSSAKTPVVNEFFMALDDSTTVDKIYANKEFSMILTKDGSLYGWGRNDRQQLGIGGGLAMDIYSCENSPELIGIESSVITIGISAADCIALTYDNEILAWGDRQYLEPTPVTPIFQDEQIKIGFEKVAVSDSYQAYILKDGTLWTSNKKISLTQSTTNCLGHGYVDPFREPRMVQALQGRFVQEISASPTKISVLVD